MTIRSLARLSLSMLPLCLGILCFSSTSWAATDFSGAWNHPVVPEAISLPDPPAPTLIRANQLKLSDVFAFTGNNTHSGPETFSGGVVQTLMSRDCRIDGSIDTTGTNDSSATINTCIANAFSASQSKVLLPCGTLKINTTLNMTNRPGMQLLGCGQHTTYVLTTPSTTLNCNTGGICVDMTGSGQSRIRGVAIRLANSFSSPSTIGILQGRDNAAGGGNGVYCFAENIHLDDVFIQSDSNVALNLGRGYIGIYNIGAEQGWVTNGFIFADTGAFYSTTNDLSISSPYQTLATGCPQSMSLVHYINNPIHAIAFAGIEARNTLDFTLDSMDFLGDGLTTGVCPIIFQAAASYGWRVSSQIESFNTPTAGAVCVGTTLNNMDFDFKIGSQTGTARGVIRPTAAGQVINNSKIRATYLNGTQNQLIDNVSTLTINGGTLDAGGTLSPLSASNVTLNGTEVHAQGFTAGNVTFNAASQYLLLSNSGLNVIGPTTSTSSIRAVQHVSDQGNVCTNGELALSAGWQSTGTATVTAVAGNGQTCSWTITTGTTTAANPTITDTLTNALPAATTVCWMNIYGGTHTAVAGESLRQTTLSATAPVFTANFTPTAGGTTYFVTRSCGP